MPFARGRSGTVVNFQLLASDLSQSMFKFSRMLRTNEKIPSSKISGLRPDLDMKLANQTLPDLDIAHCFQAA